MGGHGRRSGRAGTQGAGRSSRRCGSRSIVKREQHRRTKLEALGTKVRGGAGHELNNPLAVIVGRAQLLLARTDQPETARSLRIILSQAGRAHRILRDLIFVARPPAPRPRPCRPADLLRACLRDLQDECTARGIRLTSEIDDVCTSLGGLDRSDAWRHLGETLLRNAIQATPAGGKIVLRLERARRRAFLVFCRLRARGARLDAAHLFDPFYCGRQARPWPRPRLTSRRQAARAGRRAAELVIKPGSWGGLPGPIASCRRIVGPTRKRGCAAPPAPPPAESKRPIAR